MKLTLNVPNKLIAATAFVGVGFLAGHVAATSFPPAGTELYYSGQLTDSAGGPKLTTEGISVELYDAVTGGSKLCGTATASIDLAPTRGHFRVGLPAACADAVRDHGDVYAQVKVGDAVMPRQRLGATPFAVAARDAQNADFADEAATVSDGAIGPAQLSAALTATVNELGSRLTTVESNEVVAAGIRYSLGSIYKGSTAGTTTGQLGASAPNGTPLTGYRAAKRGCENTLNSPTAHMCTGDEIARSMQLGLAPTTNGWITSGAGSASTAAVGGGNDCDGWRSGSSSNAASFWTTTGASIGNCSNAFAIHCCD